MDLMIQEKMCEESASFDLTSLDIASCMKDITQLLKWKEGEKSGMDDSYHQDQGGMIVAGCGVLVQVALVKSQIRNV